MTEKKKQPDILIFMSDQHGAVYSEWGQTPVDTPVLSRMRREGTSFDEAYTPCPLCVPARMSLMSGLLPGRTGITGNNDTLANTIPCFTHFLANAGYETVLIGRMHFIGEDQRHGFTKRLAPDFTPVGWRYPKAVADERGLMMGTTGEPGCCDMVGAGENPVNHYDDMVVNAAIEYLSQEHEKPQFIVVGTYAPHFPYVTDKALYLKYLERVKKPNFFDKSAGFTEKIDVFNRRKKTEKITWDITKGCLAAYCGQIELMDQKIGLIKEAFDSYETRKGEKGIFGYVSDHGDQAGEHRIFGKLTFFERSSKIPMIFVGEGIEADHKVTDPVSLMDLGATVCELAGVEVPNGDGISLKAYFTDRGYSMPGRRVLSQMVEGKRGQFAENYGQYTASAMVRYKKYKYIVYHGYETEAMLFDLDKDPEETKNILRYYPETAKKLAEYIEEMCDFDAMEKTREQHDRSAAVFRKFEMLRGGFDEERWKDNPPTARGNLEIAAAYRSTMPDIFKMLCCAAEETESKE